MTTPTITCRICRGVRPTNGTHCMGCGMPVANARAQVQAPRKVTRRFKCPMCQCTVSKEIEPGRHSCRDCMAIFEPPDVGYLDDRPDRNAEKREAEQQRLARLAIARRFKRL